MAFLSHVESALKWGPSITEDVCNWKRTRKKKGPSIIFQNWGSSIKFNEWCVEKKSGVQILESQRTVLGVFFLGNRNF